MIDDLRNRIDKLKALDLTGLRARLELLHARMDLERMAETIARESDVDQDVVLLAVHASWTANINAVIDDAELDQDVFRERVEQATRRVVDALAAGRTTVGEPLIDEALTRVMHLGQRGNAPSVTAALAEVSQIVAGTR